MGERRRAGRAPVLRRRRQAGEPIHIRSKRARERDASVRFLVILEHRDERAAHGEPRAVERVAVLGAAAGGGAVADLGPARLERRAVRARRDLAVLPLPGQPDLHVVALRRLEPHIAGAVEHHPIGELEALEPLLGVPDHGLQLVVRLRGRRDLPQLDLVELVLPDHALHVLAVRPRLAAVARRERHVAAGERRLGEDLTRVERRHGDLGGGDHVERAALVGLERLEDLLLELGQEPVVLHRRGVHEVGVPHLVNAATMQNNGLLPKFEEQIFKTLEADEGRTLYMIPTAEVPVTALHTGEVLPEASLPRRYVSFTPCYRREAGTYGKDMKGMIRQHQFDKVELVKITTPAQSNDELESMVPNAEEGLRRLELPHRG